MLSPFRFRYFHIAHCLGGLRFGVVLLIGLTAFFYSTVQAARILPFIFGGVETTAQVIRLEPMAPSRSRYRSEERARVVVEYQAPMSDAPYQTSIVLFGSNLAPFSLNSGMPLIYKARTPAEALVMPALHLRVTAYVSAVMLVSLAYGYFRWKEVLTLFFSARRAALRGDTHRATVIETSPDIRYGRPSGLHVLRWRDTTGNEGQSLPTDLEDISHLKPQTLVDVGVDPLTGRQWWLPQIQRPRSQSTHPFVGP